MKKLFDYINRYGETALRKLLIILEWMKVHHTWALLGWICTGVAVLILIYIGIRSLVEKFRALKAEVAGLRVQIGEQRAALRAEMKDYAGKALKDVQDSNEVWIKHNVVVNEQMAKLLNQQDRLITLNEQRVKDQVAISEKLAETSRLTELNVKAIWHLKDCLKAILDGMMELWGMLDGKADRRSPAKAARKKRR